MDKKTYNITNVSSPKSQDEQNKVEKAKNASVISIGLITSIALQMVMTGLEVKAIFDKQIVSAICFGIAAMLSTNNTTSFVSMLDDLKNNNIDEEKEEDIIDENENERKR